MKTNVIAMCVIVAVLTGPTLADWDPGDGHKMHSPQLPDPDGWDVQAEAPGIIADDWQCSQSGLVSDIHIWGSWHEDNPGTIDSIWVTIFEDDGGEPGELLWDRFFWSAGDEFTVRHYGTGDQGWYGETWDPDGIYYVEHDHDNFYQYNFEDFFEPFYQYEGETYWLGIMASHDPSKSWGWKTSLNSFGAGCVGGDERPTWPGWYGVDDPITGGQLDMAFVITPEPATICLLGFGALGLLRKRKA